MPVQDLTLRQLLPHNMVRAIEGNLVSETPTSPLTRREFAAGQSSEVGQSTRWPLQPVEWRGCQMHELGGGWSARMHAQDRRGDSLMQELGQLRLCVAQLVVRGISQEVIALSRAHGAVTVVDAYLNDSVEQPRPMRLSEGK